MTERLSEAIVTSMRSGIISHELLEPIPQQSHPYIQRESFVLGDMAALRSIFEYYPPEIQDIFREGLIEAMKKWSAGDLESEIYEDLVWLASDTRTSEALPLIVNTIESKKLDLDNKASEGVMSASIGAFMGLNRFVDEENQQRNVVRMRNWFNDRYYEKFSGSLMNGICHFNPDDFPNLLPSFLEVAKRNPDYFILDACIQESIRVITPEKMGGYLDKLPLEARALVVERLPNA